MQEFEVYTADENARLMHWIKRRKQEKRAHEVMLHAIILRCVRERPGGGCVHGSFALCDQLLDYAEHAGAHRRFLLSSAWHGSS